MARPGAGKTTTALAVRARWGRGTALVQQDVIRRHILRERDGPGGVNIGLLDVMCRHALDTGCDVILEGILPAARYGEMLRGLISDHRGPVLVCFFAVPFPETVRRHATRPRAAEFTPEEMLEWHLPDDRLRVPGEVVLDGALTSQDSADWLTAALPGPPERSS